MNKFRHAMTGLALMTAATFAGATTTFSGNFGDAGNNALVGSNLGGPDFTDEFTIANNVALYAFTVGESELVTLVSSGFAGGGADPYFSLFRGAGISATFFDSNYAQAFSTGGDFSYSAVLAAGAYTVAISTFANMSFAENLGTGTLADGFIAFGAPDSLGDGSYAVALTTSVPEPSAMLLMFSGIAGMAMRMSRRVSRQDGSLAFPKT
jgi:hypothetical protein